MIEEIIKAMWSLGAVYWYCTEFGVAKQKKGEGELSVLHSLSVVEGNLKKVERAKSVLDGISSWIEKLDTKYSAGQKLDEKDRGDLDSSVKLYHTELFSLASKIDAEQRSLESIRMVVENLQKEFRPIREEIGGIQSLREHIAGIQKATFSFVESSPTVRSFEPTLRGLISGSSSDGLTLAGYFDQAFLTDFKNLSPMPKIKIISPELKNTKQDQVNLDALKRLKAMGAEVGFHPMLHARFALSQSEIIVGSSDIKSDCLGGRRYDAGIWTNNPILVQSCKLFADRIWKEVNPL